MDQLMDLRIGDIVRGLKRYQPFIGLVLVIVLVVGFLPGKSKETATTTTTAASGTSADTGSTIVDTSGVQETVGDSGSSVTTATGATATSPTGGPRNAPAAVAAPAVKAGVDPLAAPDCDRALGRIKFPSKWAVPCVPSWPKGTDNGGATGIGVTKDTITVALRQCSSPDDAAVSAALGIDDTPEESAQTYRDYIELFNAHYRTYGRKVKLVVFQCSGEDDAAAKADAIKVATEIKAFAHFGGPAVFIDELAARGIMCVSLGCYASAAVENYTRPANRGKVWGWYITNTQAYKHRMEYVGKRLCGRPAKWAGDVTTKTKPRKFMILSYNDATNAYKSGAEFGQKEIEKYKGADGSQCKAGLMFQTLNVQTAQEDARTIVAKLKDEGITSVLVTADPVSVIFITREATNQQYFPEWVIGASVLTDTTFFGRLYDQQQWQNAFGIAWNPARVPKEISDAWYIYRWHFGKDPIAEDVYSVIYPQPLMLFMGIHLAGAKLNADTFRDGMFSFPPTPPSAAGITYFTMSFGKHGLWEWEDFTAQDDASEIWWDEQAVGTDENGNSGVGMVRYVDGGKRYMPGQRPSTEPKAFDPAGTVTIYDKRPDADAVPNYPNQQYE